MSSHSSFKKAAVLMVVAVLASRILGLVRDILIARQFGQTGVVSAYTAAFNIPDLLYFFLSSGALSSAFIPVFTERFKTGREKEAWQIFSIIACFMGIVLTAVIVIFWIFAKPLVSYLAVPGFTENHPELVPITMLLTRIILPCQLFFFLGGLMMGTLESRQKFNAKAAGPVIYNIGIILGVIVLSKYYGIEGLAIGTLIGAFFGNIVYAFYCLKKEGFEFHFSLNIKHPGVVKVALLALPVILGLSLPQIDVIINRWFATFVSDSAPAALYNANRLMQVPVGIFAVAAGTAIMPMLAAYAAKNAFAEMRSGIGYGLRTIMLENIPSTVFMVIMADPLVRLIYMRGHFHPADVAATVVPLMFYSSGIFAWAGQAIVARGFFAMQDTITPVVMGTVSTIIFIPLNFFLMRIMGNAGIALSTTIAAIIHFFGLTYLLRNKLNGLEGTKTLKTTGKIIVAAAVMGVVCFGVRVGASRIIGSSQIYDGDITNPVKFAIKLQSGTSETDKAVFASLTSKTKSEVESSRVVDSIEDTLKQRLAEDMNVIIRNEPLLSANKSFALLNVKVDNADKNLANRDIIDATFPAFITNNRDKNSIINRIINFDKKDTHKASTKNTWEISTEDIKDLPGISKQLHDTKKSDPASSYIASKLSPDTRGLINTYVTAESGAVGLNEDLRIDINKSMQTSFICNKTNCTPKAFVRANRIALEKAYPTLILKRPFDRVETSRGSLITILAAMLLGGIVYVSILRKMGVEEVNEVIGMIKSKFSRGGNQNKTQIQPED